MPLRRHGPQVGHDPGAEEGPVPALLQEEAGEGGRGL
jgi:hypothetical protein